MGLPTTDAGEDAWALMGDVLMQRIAKESADPKTALLSGDRMLSQLEKSGGRDILHEVFGKETTENLYQLSSIMRDTNIGERLMGNYSGTAPHQEIGGMLSMVGADPMQWIKLLSKVLGTKAVGGLITSPDKGFGRKWLTQGLLQGPGEQLGVEALTRGGAQSGSRALADALGLDPKEWAKLGLTDFEKKDDVSPVMSKTRRLYR